MQLLAIEIYKALNNLSSPLMSDLFRAKDIRYSLRKGEVLTSYNVKTKSYGIDSISYYILLYGIYFHRDPTISYYMGYTSIEILLYPTIWDILP